MEQDKLNSVLFSINLRARQNNQFIRILNFAALNLGEMSPTQVRDRLGATADSQDSIIMDKEKNCLVIIGDVQEQTETHFLPLVLIL